jgi:hypothetical protein
MSTQMQRLQLSLREEQATYLARRARREGVSMAEVVRRLLDEQAAAEIRHDIESIWAISGLGGDEEPLDGGAPVSADADRYLYGRGAGTTDQPDGTAGHGP